MNTAPAERDDGASGDKIAAIEVELNLVKERYGNLYTRLLLATSDCQEGRLRKRLHRLLYKDVLRRVTKHAVMDARLSWHP